MGRAFLGPEGTCFAVGIHCPLHIVKKQNNTSYIFTRPEALTPCVSLTPLQGEGPTDKERGESLPQPLPAHPPPQKTDRVLCIDTESEEQDLGGPHSGEEGRGLPQPLLEAVRRGRSVRVSPAGASQVTLPVQGCGEGLVVEGAGHSVRALVWSHASDAVLGLVRGQLSPQLLSRDEVLEVAGWDSGPPTPTPILPSPSRPVLAARAPPHQPPGCLQGILLTLSPARTLKEAMTWSAVSVSVVSLDMKSMKAWKVTRPLWLGSTTLMMRLNSASPCEGEWSGGQVAFERGRTARPGPVDALPMERSQESRAQRRRTNHLLSVCLQGFWLPQAKGPTRPDWGCAPSAPPHPRFWEVGELGNGSNRSTASQP